MVKLSDINNPDKENKNLNIAIKTHWIMVQLLQCILIWMKIYT